ncbi:MAG: hypothetical protein ACYTGV_20460 [Planctomycetota bacterium]|jgi:hypothetical protein
MDREELKARLAGLAGTYPSIAPIIIKGLAQEVLGHIAELEEELSYRQRLWTMLSQAISRRSTAQIRERYGGNTPEWINGETDELTVLFREFEESQEEVARLREALEAVAHWDASHRLAGPYDPPRGLTVGVRAMMDAALRGEGGG